MDESQKKAKKPLYKSRALRTIFLALLATGCFVGSAIWIFDVDWRLMLEFFLACLLGLGLVIAAALGFTVLRVWLRRWLD